MDSVAVSIGARVLAAQHRQGVGAASIRVERRRLTTVSLVALAGIAVFVTVLLTGGTPNSLGHLAYVPISIAAYRSGWRGGVIAAVVGSVMLGPVVSAMDLEGNGEVGWPWFVRGVLFVGLGWLLGWLFDRSRTAVTAWRETAIQLTESQHDSMAALAAAAEAKDPTTGNHMHRCRGLAEVLAREAGLGEPVVADIAWSAMLHDIGKLYVPDSVLTKPGPLGAAEWELIRSHPVRGAELLELSRTFETARRIARWHHENIDGTGYPDGLRGSRIPLEARIVRVVDAWDAMVNDRPYRRALAVDQAMQQLRDGAGTEFDPELVEVFLALAEAGRLPLL